MSFKSTGKLKLGSETRAALISRNRKAARNRRAQSQRRQSTVLLLKSMGEKKGVDTPLVYNPVIATTSTNAGIFVVNLVQTGNGSWNRVGRSIQNHSLRIRGEAYQTVTLIDDSALVSSTLRMVVVWDKQPSGVAIPSFDDIFGHTLQDGTEASNFLDAIRYDNMGRFQILRDTLLRADIGAVSSSNTTSDTARYTASFDEYIKLGGRETIFSGQSTPMTIADISTGALYVIFRAEGQTAQTYYQISGDSFARLRYTD